MPSARTPNSAFVTVADPTAVTVRSSVSISSATARIAAPRSPLSASDWTGTSIRSERYSSPCRSITRLASSGAAANRASYTSATFRSGTPSPSVSASAYTLANFSLRCATARIVDSGEMTRTWPPCLNVTSVSTAASVPTDTRSRASGVVGSPSISIWVIPPPLSLWNSLWMYSTFVWNGRSADSQARGPGNSVFHSATSKSL